MADDMQILFVLARRLNVRSSPEIRADNLIETFHDGDTLCLAPEVTISDDGWVWRRLVDSDVHWVAEFNEQNPDHRLLGDTFPEETPVEQVVRHVQVSIMKIRSFAGITLTNAIGTKKHGMALPLEPIPPLLGEEGWVWRKLAAPDKGWVAEYNARNGQRLLSREPVIQDDPVPEEPIPQPLKKGRVLIKGHQFVLDGKPFRFVGANLRELPFYEDQHVLPFANTGHQTEQLKSMVDMGMKVVRFHACNRDITLTEAISLVGKALDLLQDQDLLAIVVLNDALGKYWVPGDERFHMHWMGHLDKHAYFHNEGYRDNYLPYVKAMVKAHKTHPAIFAWELGNEYAIHPQPASKEDGAAFARFASHVSDVIREIDPNHLITTGLVNTGHVAPNDAPGHDRMTYGKKLYGLPNIDFLTVHFYEGNSEEASAMPDVEIAKQLDMPLIVEEWGPTSGGATLTNQKMTHWFALGCAGFMQWGLSATTFDIGVGDSKHGMDPYADNNKAHFQDMVKTYKQWAAQLKS